MPRCFNCMQFSQTDDGICPACGHNIDEKQKFDDALPTGALIADRFTVGAVKEKDDFGFRYIAYDNVFDKVRTVKEFFPAGARRTENGYGVTGIDEAQAEKFYEKNNRLREYDYFESVLEVFGCEKENGTVYVITEHQEGRTLSEILDEKGQLTFKETVSLTRPLLTALSGLNSAGIFHGSISPDTVFVGNNNKVKFLKTATSVITTDSLKTGFAPKEQYSDIESINAETDIYSICAVIYRMLTGITPADSRTRGTPSDEFVPLCGTADIPVRAEDALMKGLSVNPEDRQKTAEDILDAMLGRVRISAAPDTVQQEETVESGEEKNGSGKENKNHKSKGLIALAAVIAVLGIALVMLAVWIMPKLSTGGDEPQTSAAEQESETSQTQAADRIILRQEAYALYDNFFKSTDFKTDYERDYAIKIKDDDLFKNSTEFPSDVKSLASASTYQTYLDIDGDSTVECIWTSDLDGKQKYVDIYIFDLDENGEVFEGGRIAYSSGGNENIDLCTVVSARESIYYFLRSTDRAYDEDTANRDSFEVLYYNGSELICTASAGANRLSLAQGGTPELYCATGVVITSDGTLWNPASPTGVKSVYAYDSERYAVTGADYTAVDQSAFETIWNKNSVSVNKKITLKAIEIVDTSVEVSVIFPGMTMDARDVEMTRVTPEGSEVFLYTCDGRPMQFVKMLDRRDFTQPYKIEIYYGENKYCECTVTLDEEFKPVYKIGEVQLIRMPDVRGMSRNEAIETLKGLGFTKIYTSNGARPGLLKMSKVGKVQSQNIDAGEYISKDTEINLKIYRAA